MGIILTARQAADRLPLRPRRLLAVAEFETRHEHPTEKLTITRGALRLRPTAEKE